MRVSAAPLVRNQSGSVAILFGIMVVPLILFVGAGIDMMRAADLRAQLQAAADSAALAGATVYNASTTSSAAQTVAANYVASAQTKFSANTNLTSSTACSTSGASGATLYSCTVSLSATQANAVMAILTSSLPISVTATAQNPVYTVNFSLTGFSSSAYDYNAIYWYIVPKDGGVPSASDMKMLYCNNIPSGGTGLLAGVSAALGGTSVSASASVNFNAGIASCTNANPSPPQVTAGQRIGFALKNVTGGLKGYGSNGYGGMQGSTHWFYSHLSPPSSQAYSSVSRDCSLQVVPKVSSGTPSSGACLAANPSYSSLSCAQASGQTLSYYWNDMGGGRDDYDFNDAVFTVTCAASDASRQTGVILSK